MPQDKASCFPAHILLSTLHDGVNDPTLRYDIIDACAAPGNKTSHAASLLAGAKGSAVAGDSNVFAFDKSTRRLALMERRMKEAGADKHVKCRAADFLRVCGHSLCS